MKKLILLPLNDTVWSERNRYLLKYVSKERADYVMQFRREVDQCLSLYAALLTRMAISQVTDSIPSELVFAARTQKKPALLSCKTSTAGQKDRHLDFNVSHTENVILFAMTDEGTVGVDVERIDRKAPFSIEKRAFHSEEIAYIHSMPEEQKEDQQQIQAQRFYECWTRKEAWTKELGTGLAADLKAINTRQPDCNHSLITFSWENYIGSISFHSLKRNETAGRLTKEDFCPSVFSQEDIVGCYLQLCPS